MGNKPPIMMSMPGELRFSKEGQWFNDGVLVSHKGVAEYFSRHLRFSAEHDSYVVEVDGKCVRAEIEDTAHVVKSIDTEVLPWTLRLETGEEEVFDAETLAVSAENVFYCRRAKSKEWLRILRAPMQRLLPLISEDASGTPSLVHGKKRYTIGKKRDE